MSDFERSGEETEEEAEGAEETGSGDLTPAQERAVTALLTCRTLDEAAKSAGTSVATLRRWRSLPAFDEAYRAARLAFMEATTNALRAASGDAVAALVRNLTCGKAGDEIRAATAILSSAVKSVELEELSERIASVEAMQEAAALAADRDKQNGGRRYAG